MLPAVEQRPAGEDILTVDIPAPRVEVRIADPAVEAREVSIFYGAKPAIREVSLRIPRRSVTAIIGPSGCGKSTFLRAINRMNDTIVGCRTTGQLLVNDQDVYGYSGPVGALQKFGFVLRKLSRASSPISPPVDPVELRRRVGLIFQKPNPFPKSIYENIAFAVRLHYRATFEEIDEIVEAACRQANLWGEVEDRLDESALSLSGGQQQRLCIARALAVEPDILLMDEPCSALDPVATSKIEDLIFELRKEMTIVIVTHNMQQAARVAEQTAFLYLGRLIEYNRTTDLFERPLETLTENYITGRFG